MGDDKKKPKRHRLYGLSAKEVSLVPVGANDRTFLLHKSFEGEPMEELLKRLAAVTLEKEADIDAILKAEKLSEEQMKAAKGALKALKAVEDMLPEGMMKKLKKLFGYEEEEKAEKSAPQLTSQEMVDLLLKEGFKVEEPAKGKGEEMDKEVQAKLESIQKEHAAALEKVQKENESLRTDLKREQDLRVMKELVAKAESFGYRGEQAEKVAKALSVAQSMPKEDYETLESSLKEAGQRTVSATLLKEIGSGKSGESSYEAKMAAKVAEIRKEMPKASLAELENEALKREPGLYKQYLAENPKQIGA